MYAMNLLQLGKGSYHVEYFGALPSREQDLISLDLHIQSVRRIDTCDRLIRRSSRGEILLQIHFQKYD